MSVKQEGLPGIGRQNISETAGIRPHQLNVVYASTSAFQLDKSSDTGGLVTSALSAGDWYVNSGNNYSQDVQGASMLQQMGGVAQVVVPSTLTVSAGASLVFGTLVAAPGAGRIIVPNSIHVKTTGATSSTDGSPYVVCYGTGLGNVSATGAIPISALSSGGATRFTRVLPVAVSALATSAVNLGLIVARSGSLALSGATDVAVTVTVAYDILTL